MQSITLTQSIKDKTTLQITSIIATQTHQYDTWNTVSRTIANTYCMDKRSQMDICNKLWMTNQ